MQPCTPFFPAPTPSSPVVPSIQADKKSKKLSTGAIIAIPVGCSVASLLLFLLLLLLCFRKCRQSQQTKPTAMARAAPVVEAGMSTSKEDITVMEKGSVGTSYKAVLEEGTTVVMKMLKDVSVAKREFGNQKGRF
ncbi:putative inactive receptor kinase [Senna tora]|uniref:Putative inactive receptor kinase n=1 Tax=Senna tora TaxID=362788 RepID=A0A834VZ31_9FABA|nr:putative inactive receptor kinase [Senna tora]